MSDAKPIMNLAEAPTKSGGNGSKFDFKLWHFTRRSAATEYYDGES